MSYYTENPVHIPEPETQRRWDREEGRFKQTFRLSPLRAVPRETDFIAYLFGRTDV